MRKYITLIVLCSLLLPACNKQEPVNAVEPQQKEVTLNLNIGSKPGFDSPAAVEGAQVGTKAIKTDWESGDHLYVFLLEEGANYRTDTKIVVLTHNGTGFAVTKGQEDINAITKKGTIQCAYVSGEEVTFKAEELYSYDIMDYWTYYHTDEDAFNGRYILGAECVEYTFSENKIAATIAFDNKYLTEYQITLVMPSDSYDWTLSTYNDDTSYNQLRTAVQVTIYNMEVGNEPESYGEYVPSEGVKIDDGLVFYFGGNKFGDTQDMPVKLILDCKTIKKQFAKDLPLNYNFTTPEAYKLYGPTIEDGNLSLLDDNHGWTLWLDYGSI